MIYYGYKTQSFDGIAQSRPYYSNGNYFENHNMWISSFANGTTSIANTWIGYTFIDPKNIYQIKLYNGYNGRIYPNAPDYSHYTLGSTPSMVTVQYSDNNSVWTSAQQFAITNKDDYGCNIFILSSNFGAHLYWRVLANDAGNNPGMFWRVSELQMMSNIAEPIINTATINSIEVFGNPLDCTSPLVFEAIDANTINDFENAYEIENDFIINPDDGKQIVDYYLYRYKSNLSFLNANTIGIPQIDLLDRITITDTSSGSGINFDFIVTVIKHSIKKDGFKTNLQLESLIPAWTYDPSRVDMKIYKLGVQAISIYRYTDPPSPTNLTLTESTYVQKSGEVITELQVLFNPASYSYYDHTSIQISQLTIDDQIIWKDVGNSVEGKYLIHNLKVGTTYHVRLQTVSLNGLTSDWVTTSIITTGKDSPPGDIVGFNITQSGATLTVSIVPPTDPDLRNFEIRLGPTWANSSLMKTFNDVQTTFLAPQEGVQTFWCKAVDNGGGYSLNAKKCVISIYGLPLLNIISDTIEDINTWTITGMYHTPLTSMGCLVIDTIETIDSGTYFADIFEGGSTLRSDSTILFPPIDLGPNIIADGYFYIDPWGVVKINTTKKVSDYVNFYAIFGDPIVYVTPQYKLITTMNIDIDYTQSSANYIDIQFRTSLDGTHYTDWVDLINHHFFGRYLQLRLTPGSLDNQTNVKVCGAEIKIDVPDLEENIENVSISAIKTHINFVQNFYDVPKSISLWTMDSTGKMCTWRMTNVTISGFDLELLDSGGSLIAGKLVRACVRGY